MRNILRVEETKGDEKREEKRGEEVENRIE